MSWLNHSVTFRLSWKKEERFIKDGLILEGLNINKEPLTEIFKTSSKKYSIAPR